MFSRYIAYLKDNPEHYWFKRKIYGWGWVPATWEGLLALFVFLGLFWLAAQDISSKESVLAVFTPKIIVLVLIFLAVCYKTGEKPRWQWGFPQKRS